MAALRQWLIGGGLAVSGLAALGAQGNPVGLQTRPVSPSVLATLITGGDQTIQLLVLWRGAPGWFSRNGHSGSTGGGSGLVVRTTLDYGGVSLTLAYDRAGGRVEIQDRPLTLPRSANVVLVDGVDTAGGPTSIAVAAVEGHLETDSNPALGALLGRSAEVAAFLRCEIPTPRPIGPRWACEDMAAKEDDAR